MDLCYCKNKNLFKLKSKRDDWYKFIVEIDMGKVTLYIYND